MGGGGGARGWQTPEGRRAWSWIRYTYIFTDHPIKMRVIKPNLLKTQSNDRIANTAGKK